MTATDTVKDVADDRTLERLWLLGLSPAPCPKRARQRCRVHVGDDAGRTRQHHVPCLFPPERDLAEKFKRASPADLGS